MIYCVVPEELADELYPKLAKYYQDDPNVKVIIDRRKSERRAGEDRRDREARDEAESTPRPGVRGRRRPRVAGGSPRVDRVERRSPSTTTAGPAATPAPRRPRPSSPD